MAAAGFDLTSRFEAEAAVRASATPLSGPPVCAPLRGLGADAVESLTLDVELPGGGGDLFVETLEPAERH